MENFSLQIKKLIEDELLNVIDFLITDLKRELIDQGHVLTGKLRDSIELLPLLKTNDTTTCFVALESYYRVLETGITAANVKAKLYNPDVRTGKKTSLYIEALIGYWKKRKGLSDQEAKAAAFATARKHSKEGFPTTKSWEHSSNGRRLAFLSHVVDDSRHIDSFEDRMADMLEGVSEKILDKFQLLV